MIILSQNFLSYTKSVIPSTRQVLVHHHGIQLRSLSSPPASHLTRANLRTSIIIIYPLHHRFPILANRGHKFASTIILIRHWRLRGPLQVRIQFDITSASQYPRRRRHWERRWLPKWRRRRRVGWRASTMFIAARV